MGYYLQEYRKVRTLIQKEIKEAFLEAQIKHEGDIGVKFIKDLFENLIPEKSPSPAVYWARDITLMRAFIYSLVCGENSKNISSENFMAAVNRFGLDSPCPTVTKRLGNYGNQDEIDKDFKRIVNKYKENFKHIEEFQHLDPNIHPPTEFKTGGIAGISFGEQSGKGGKVYDFNQHQPWKPSKKMTGLMNMSFLGANKHK